jgi:GTP cyclohydrolase IB
MMLRILDSSKAMTHDQTMHSPHSQKPLIDVQSSSDLREIAIKNVGVKSLKLPISLAFSASTEIKPLDTIANVDLYVGLAKDVKGTHMSRLLEVFNEQKAPFNFNNLKQLMEDMLTRLEATTGSIHINAPYFIEKTAPVSGVKSLMDYELGFEIIQASGRDIEVYLKLLVPVKSLCPCSKKISEYGAHNQRSHIKVKVLLKHQIDADQLIREIEKQGSSEIWAVLKREDEKFITEKAYENPKFVEDLVRDVALMLNRHDGIAAYELSAENFESIHNHSAYAEIVGDKR